MHFMHACDFFQQSIYEGNWAIARSHEQGLRNKQISELRTSTVKQLSITHYLSGEVILRQENSDGHVFYKAK